MKPQNLSVLPPEQPFVAEGGAMDIATSRQAQEVMAAMAIAKRFPRNETTAMSRIMSACDRISLAESALYSYPRGGTTVTGPSIRMAEALARGWGNIDHGVIELEQKNGESTVMAYAWDLETNARSTKVFTVKHERKANSQIKKLDDPRDIYEMVANQGARRLRACILSIIPGDVIDLAVERCEDTMKKGDKTPMKERVAKTISFLSNLNVTVPMIEKRLGHKIDSISETELVNLRKICKSLDDNAAKVEDFFDKGAVTNSEQEKPTTSIPAPKPVDDVPMDFQTPPTPASAPTQAAPVAPPISQAEETAETMRLLSELGNLCQVSAVSIDQVFAYAKANKLAPKSADAIEQMMNTKIALLISQWAHIVDKIKAITV